MEVLGFMNLSEISTNKKADALFLVGGEILHELFVRRAWSRSAQLPLEEMIWDPSHKFPRIRILYFGGFRYPPSRNLYSDDFTTTKTKNKKQHAE